MSNAVVGSFFFFACGKIKNHHPSSMIIGHDSAPISRWITFHFLWPFIFSSYFFFCQCETNQCCVAIDRNNQGDGSNKKQHHFHPRYYSPTLFPGSPIVIQRSFSYNKCFSFECCPAGGKDWRIMKRRISFRLFPAWQRNYKMLFLFFFSFTMKN